MPTYEYKCSKCNIDFEEVQSMKSDPVASCPECGEQSKRVFSLGGGIIFKGSGFYVNDYKNKTKSSECASCPSNSEK
jgi:putative FmdB family regulatory protein